uniref:GYF domain-containing protein n=1 Tax=Heterosigma akashiwo TaxID=2829 RepID=A0A7S4DBJ5_HETAK
MWEYKGQDGAIQGPYSTEHILAWKAQGFFIGNQVVKIRKVKNKREEKTGGGDDENPKKTSAADELAADFDDSDDDDNETSKKKKDDQNNGGAEDVDEGWAASDTIDFNQYV